MKKLWNYEDYVKRLSHPNRQVRRWAFDAIENRFPRTFTTETAGLLNDPDEYLACMAPRYLARHNAVEFAPAILTSFKNNNGDISSNCARALGDMAYLPAFESITDKLFGPVDFSDYLGCMHYLGKIKTEESRQTVKAYFNAIPDLKFANGVIRALLSHQHPEDVPIVIETIFAHDYSIYDLERMIGVIVDSVNADNLHRDMNEYSKDSIIESPEKIFDKFVEINPQARRKDAMLRHIAGLITNRNYRDLTATLLSDAMKDINSRYPDNTPEYLLEIKTTDIFAGALLEAFSKNNAMWGGKYSKDTKEIFISAVIAIYFSIHERGGFVHALHPESSLDTLIESLKTTGSSFPEALQKRIALLSPVEELKNALSEDLMTWGDIWTVRIMGETGRSEFVPDLIKIVNDVDGLSHIHEEAIKALNAMDESAHERMLAAIEKNEIKDAYDTKDMLECLPYDISFDLAERLWNDTDRDMPMDSYEMYALCLEGIGDPRGIKALQDIFYEGNSIYIGDSLETLCALYDTDIPELPVIEKIRKEHEERIKQRRLELDKMAANYYQHDDDEPQVETYVKSAPKIGRNAPCPCGSGKKYKKCCLNK